MPGIFVPFGHFVPAVDYCLIVGKLFHLQLAGAKLMSLFLIVSDFELNVLRLVADFIPCKFGHIGESHLHFNFLPRTSEQSQQAQQALAQLCRKAVSLKGTVSAEHGIGKIKKPYLALMYGPAHIQEMVRLKKYFDPHCLLGLDTLFDRELLFMP